MILSLTGSLWDGPDGEVPGLYSTPTGRVHLEKPRHVLEMSRLRSSSWLVAAVNGFDSMCVTF